jgi:hypothetical protein
MAVTLPQSQKRLSSRPKWRDLQLLLKPLETEKSQLPVGGQPCATQFMATEKRIYESVDGVSFVGVRHGSSPTATHLNLRLGGAIRFDVLVESQQIRWVVLFLDLH